VISWWLLMNPSGGIFSERPEKLKVVLDSLKALFDYPEIVFSFFSFRVGCLQKVNGHPDDTKRVVDFMSDVANPAHEVLKLLDKIT
jgi:hypothetical protein